MKILIFIISLTYSLNSFSKSINVEISSVITVDNISEQRVSKLRVELKKEFVLPSKKSKILVRIEELKGVARGPGGERPMLFSAEIYQIKNGKIELVSKPHIVTYIGKIASFKTIDYAGREVSLKVKILPSK